MLPRRLSRAVTLLCVFALAGAGAMMLAQDSGPAPGDSAGSYEVGGVEVDVTAPNAEVSTKVSMNSLPSKNSRLPSGV